MRRRILIAGERVGELVEAANQLDDESFPLSVLNITAPAVYLTKHRFHDVAGLLVRLTGGEHLPDLEAFFDAYHGLPVVCVDDGVGFDAEMTSLIVAHGGAVVSDSADSMIAVAQLVAMMFERSEAQ